MTSPVEVRVVMAGFPPAVHVALDTHPHRAEVAREVLADGLPSIDEGRELAEQELRSRGLRVGQWQAIGPCVLRAPITGKTTA